jgi:hypothetical protein
MKEIFLTPIFSGLRGRFVELGNSRKSANEISSETYYATLAEVDRKHVEAFIEWVGDLDEAIYETPEYSSQVIVVNAVGSSVMPEEKRFRGVNDIDLRVLSSARSKSPERKALIEFITNSIRTHLENINVKYEEDDCTDNTRWIKGTLINPNTHESKIEQMPYIDWYNDDPSFKVTFEDGGKPLHISILGLGNPDLGKYLKMEAKNKGFFSSLFNSTEAQDK